MSIEIVHAIYDLYVDYMGIHMCQWLPCMNSAFTHAVQQGLLTPQECEVARRDWYSLGLVGRWQQFKIWRDDYSTR